MDLHTKQCLRHCDLVIEKARREYDPKESVWDVVAPSEGVIEINPTPEAERIIHSLENELEEKHLRIYGIVKVVNGLKKQIMWGLNRKEVVSSFDALTAKLKSYHDHTYEIIVGKERG